jgi:co-chaperonin GroES (HSP10)
MSVIIPHRAVEAISLAKDPKKAIPELIGNLDGIEVIGDMVLVGIYIRPEKTAGGIIRPSVNKQEDVWQGKVGLVLKWGPDAFIDPDTGKPYAQNVPVGDWCVFKVGDGWSLHINDYPCRLVRDVAIRMKIQDPTAVL